MKIPANTLRRLRSFSFASAFTLVGSALLMLSMSVSAQEQAVDPADDSDTTAPLALGTSGLEMTPPKTWRKQEPRSRIVQYEFAVASDMDEAADVRITIMQAGGGLEPNVARWIGQFSQPDGTATKERTKRQQREIAEQEVHVVDISGSYKDQPQGPFGPSVDRPDYRMLAAILKTEAGNFFIKMYGHQDLIAKSEASFGEFLDSLKKSSS